MEGFLIANPQLTNIPGSPTNSFLADEVASTCPLLTPSPPTNDLINPPLDNSEPNFVHISSVLADKLQHVQDDDKTAVDSASSSSSALAEPACGQLLNHRHHYQHITKDENIASQETNGKVNTLQMTFKHPPENYFFMTWNWPLIRKISAWTFLAGLFAMVALVVAMIYALPKRCDPITQWYQGGVMYEVFPASFHDTNGDGIGDLKGISYYADYIQSLGVRGVRLNSIFSAHNYPEDYRNVLSIKDIAAPLGTFKDFKIMVDSLHLRNISVLLDMPIDHMHLPRHVVSDFNDTDEGAHGSIEFLRTPRAVDEIDEVTDALQFWLGRGVDGFYLKGLEHHLDNRNMVVFLRKWKRLLGPERALIVNHAAVTAAPKEMLNVLLNNIDLVDVHVHVEQGVDKIRTQLESLQNGTLFSKASMPWIHWSLGDVDTARLASRLPFGNATLGATLLQLMLPGTPSIFYGDEVGIRQVADMYSERDDIKHIHQLGAMMWRSSDKHFTEKGHLPWMHGQPTESNFEQLPLISNMAKLRLSSPSVYVNSVIKDGVYKANAEVKYSQGDLLVIQRYYPRRKSLVVVSNLGPLKQTADLSKLLYSGDVMVGPRADSVSRSVSFKDISLWPGESVVIRLD